MTMTSIDEKLIHLLAPLRAIRPSEKALHNVLNKIPQSSEGQGVTQEVGYRYTLWSWSGMRYYASVATLGLLMFAFWPSKALEPILEVQAMEIESEEFLIDLDMAEESLLEETLMMDIDFEYESSDN